MALTVKRIKKKTNLSHQLALILKALLETDYVHTDEVIRIISQINPNVKKPDIAARMAMYRLRKMLSEEGHLLLTTYGKGYSINVADRTLIRSFIRGV